MKRYGNKRKARLAKSRNFCVLSDGYLLRLSDYTKARELIKKYFY